VIGAIRTLGGGRGPACEELSLCYWAGSAFKVDFFNYGAEASRRRRCLPGDCEETFLGALPFCADSGVNSRAAGESAAFVADCLSGVQ